MVRGPRRPVPRGKGPGAEPPSRETSPNGGEWFVEMVSGGWARRQAMVCQNEMKTKVHGPRGSAENESERDRGCSPLEVGVKYSRECWVLIEVCMHRAYLRDDDDFKMREIR